MSNYKIIDGGSGPMKFLEAKIGDFIKTRDFDVALKLSEDEVFDIERGECYNTVSPYDSIALLRVELNINPCYRKSEITRETITVVHKIYDRYEKFSDIKTGEIFIGENNDICIKTSDIDYFNITKRILINESDSDYDSNARKCNVELRILRIITR